MINETLISSAEQQFCAKTGRDIFDNLAYMTSKMHSSLTKEEILTAFHRRKTGSIQFVVGEETFIWHFA
jgi:hypothetical protein